MGLFDQPIVANADEANTGGDFTPIPEGIYNLVIEKSELRKSKAGNEMLSLAFRVEDGEYEKRKLFMNLNLDHPNQVTVEIAKKQLHALLILCSLKTLEHQDDLIGQALSAKVLVKKRADTGQLNNEVLLSIKRCEAITPVIAKPQAAADTAPRPVTGKSKW